MWTASTQCSMFKKDAAMDVIGGSKIAGCRQRIGGGRSQNAVLRLVGRSCRSQTSELRGLSLRYAAVDDERGRKL